MEKKDYYTLKEIILGLNHEYQLHQQELEKLKQFCELDKKKAVDFNFDVVKFEKINPKKNPILLCDYVPKQNKIQKLITDYSQKKGFYIYGRYTTKLLTDYNQYYFYKRPYPIHISMEEEFYNQANLILNSDFSRNIKSKYIEKNHSDIDVALDIDTRYIWLYIRSDSDKLQKSTMWYSSSDNTLEFRMDEGHFSNQLIEDTLNLEFPSSELNPYHITSINASKMAEKPIVLGYVNPVDTIRFTIVEEENQVVLSKTRR